MTTTLPSRKTDRMIELFGRFEDLQTARRAGRRERMVGFLQRFEEEHYNGLTTGPVNFNVFRALRIADYEIRHSAFLAWLLDGRGEHRRGTAFLHAFLEACGIHYRFGHRELPIVRTEYRERCAFIDVMIYTKGGLLVYVENKVGAPEGDRQLANEFGDMQELGTRLLVPKDRQYAVFLTPHGRPPTTNEASHWHTLSYRQLADAFAALLPGLGSDRLRFIVGDWIEIAREIGDTP